MYYEFFIDKFFLENMIIDYLVLSLTGYILKYRTSWLRLILASGIGALGMCIIFIFPVQNTFVNTVLGFGILGLCMIKVGFPIKGRNQLIRGMIVLYLSAFLLGGIWNMLFYRVALPMLVLGIISYFTLRMILKVYQNLKYKTECQYEVALYLNGKCKHILGLLDTGNQLKQPVTGKPVSIVDFQSIREILNEEESILIEKMFDFDAGVQESNRICYIPYHSIGKSRGILPGVCLDYMSIEKRFNTKLMKKPVIAITKEPVSAKDEYQMILHPLVCDD